MTTWNGPSCPGAGRAGLPIRDRPRAGPGRRPGPAGVAWLGDAGLSLHGGVEHRGRVVAGPDGADADRGRGGAAACRAGAVGRAAVDVRHSVLVRLDGRVG